MAYVSQEFKAERAVVVKSILKKYGIKGSLSVRDHSTLVLTIRSGALDFISNFTTTYRQHPRFNDQDFRPVSSIDVNVYHYRDHFSGRVRQCITELVEALKGPAFFDHSDSQTDYFHCSHYYSIRIGNWNNPYTFTK